MPLHGYCYTFPLRSVTARVRHSLNESKMDLG